MINERNRQMRADINYGAGKRGTKHAQPRNKHRLTRKKISSRARCRSFIAMNLLLFISAAM